MQIPAHAELIWGLDKKELQESLNEEVSQKNKMARFTSLCTSVPNSSNLNPHRKGILRTHGDVLHPGIRSEIYYQSKKAREAPELLRDPSEWLEYLNNVIMCPLMDLPVRIRVQHKMYGATSSTWEIPMTSLLSYFDSNGFKNYVGFEREGDRSILGTAVFKHKRLDFSHLLIINNLEYLIANTQEPQVLDADLYTFVRSDNVASLYGDYVDRQGEQIPISINP